MSLNLVKRTQFCTVLNGNQRLLLLRALAKIRLNITGYTQSYKIVSFVISSSDPIPDKRNVAKTRRIFKKLNLPYESHYVLEVNGEASSGVSGIFLQYERVLATNQIKLYQLYIGEKNSFFLDVGTNPKTLQKTRRVLAERLIPQSQSTGNSTFLSQLF